MIEEVSFWNEPKNKSHWDFEVDSEPHHTNAPQKIEEYADFCVKMMRRYA